MNRHTVAVLVSNKFGVLNRVTSMFRRRQFNINSLTVSETESTETSRITVTFEGKEVKKQQLINQLYKLPDVLSIKELNAKTSVSCELMLIKMENNPAVRDDIITAANAFGADTIDYSSLKNDVIEIKGRHDPCVVLRAVPVVEAAANIAILSHMLDYPNF